MFIFHEGLPGCGKSYEAAIEWILPALKKGRKVFARMNGLNHEKFSELAEITLDRCQELLIHIEENQVHTIDKHVENDSLVIIDELQNFWPSGRVKLSDDITKFVTEHRHRGLDIVGMGQSIADCHNIWRRRCQRKIQFLKLDALGSDKRYRWTSYQGIPDAKGEIRFEKINQGIKSYDPKYFGLYASHQADTENTANLSDARLNIFNRPAFKLGIPVLLGVAAIAIYYLSIFFSPPQPEDLKPKEPVKQQFTQSGQQQTQQSAQPVRSPDADFITDLNAKYQSQLSYLSEYRGFIHDALVIFVDDSNRVIDQLYYQDLKDLGYTVTSKSFGLVVTKGTNKFLFRWKPKFEAYGTVPEQTKEQIQ